MAEGVWPWRRVMRFSGKQQREVFGQVFGAFEAAVENLEGSGLGLAHRSGFREALRHEDRKV